MNKKEFLAMNLPHDLKVAEFNDEGKLLRVQTLYGGNYSSFCEFNYYKPVCRPLSDLTKPIIHNGEEFVPALELIKLEEKYNKWKDTAPTIPYDAEIINKPFGQMLKVSKLNEWVLTISFSEIERAKYYVISQLAKWHFNLMDESEEFVDVSTLPENPYK